MQSTYKLYQLIVVDEYITDDTITDNDKTLYKTYEGSVGLNENIFCHIWIHNKNRP